MLSLFNARFWSSGEEKLGPRKTTRNVFQNLIFTFTDPSDLYRVNVTNRIEINLPLIRK